MAAAAFAPAAVAEDAYIESDGSQFINTGYYPSGKTKIEVDFQLTSVASAKDCVFGNYGDPNFSVLLYANPGNFQFCGKDGGWNGVSTGVAVDTERHTMVIDVPNKKGSMYAPDGTLQGEAAFNASWTYANKASWPIALFASCNNTTGSSARQPVSARIYGVKIYEDGTLVHDYEPVVKGGVAGFLDSVTSAFLCDTRTSGAGTFASGGDIQTVDDDPYVESDGTSGINLGLVAAPGLKIEVDYAMAVVEAGAGGDYQQRIFGEDADDKNPRISVYVNGSGNVSLASGDGWVASSTGIAADTRRHKAVIDNEALKWAFTTGPTTNWSHDATADLTKWAVYPLGLFANPTSADGTTFNRLAKAKVYGLKIWQGGTLVRDLAPRSIDGVAGFEDLATGKFFTCDGLTASANAPTALTGRVEEGDAFIECDGSYYSTVDTRYFPSVKTKIEVDFQTVNLASGKDCLFGNYGCDFSVLAYLSGGTIKLEAKDGGHATLEMTPKVSVGGTRHKVVIDAPAKHATVYAPDGTVEGEADFPSGWTYAKTSNWPLTLFGSATTPYGKTRQNTYSRIFGAKIWESSDSGATYTLIHDYTPCVKGGIPGFYDKVAGNFLSGDGLTAGGATMTLDEDPYVESGDSGCFFDTGYYVTSNTSVMVDFMLLRQQGDQQFPFEAGAGNTSGKSFMRTYGNGTAGTGDFAYALGTDTYKSMEVPYAPWARSQITLDTYNLKAIVAKNGMVVREMATAAGGQQAEQSSTTLKLLSNGSADDHWCKARLYGVKIYEEGVLVRDYVPICQAEAYALRDKVTGTVLAKAAKSAAFTGFTPNGDQNDSFFDAEMRAEDAYIESDGTQGINLGYFTTPETRYEIDYKLNEIVPQNRVFGEATSALSAELYIQGTGNVAFGAGNSWVGQPSGVAADLNRHVALIDFANRECGYSGKGLYAFTSSTVCSRNATYPMWLFVKGTGATGQYDATTRAKMRLYAFRIFEAGALVHEYLPYTNGDTVGLYDTMTGDVKTSSIDGSGAFTLGGGLGYGKFAGSRMVLTTAPQDAEVSLDRPKTLSAFAPGAIGYVWKRAGEVIDGETGQTLTVQYQRVKSGSRTTTYTVAPVFLKNGVETLGEEAAATVTMVPAGIKIILR